MESQITLTARNMDKLNKLIDYQLTQGYLLKGGVQKDEQGELSQLMILPNNIDGEITLAGILRMLIMMMIMASVLYFAL